MIREAELFVQSEQVLVEVLGRIREEHHAIVLPPLLDVPGYAEPTPLLDAVRRYARETAAVPHLLAGARAEDVPDDGDPLGREAQAAVVRLSAQACAAAREVGDGDAVVHAAGGDLPAAEYLLRLTIAGSLLAHDVAMHLGSRACPFTEDLARGLWQRTDPEAAVWRERGYFREPILPLPSDVSWRDRFLLCAGRDPHPLVDH